jgi:hypothetical protein
LIPRTINTRPGTKKPIPMARSWRMPTEIPITRKVIPIAKKGFFLDGFLGLFLAILKFSK